MNIKPLKDNVLIVPEKKTEKNKTESGIFLPESSTNDQERPQIGKVMAIGDSEKIKVKKNQTIIFAKYSGSEIKIDNDDFLILKTGDILAIVE